MTSLIRVKQGYIRVPAKTVMFADTMSGDVHEGYFGYCADNTAINSTSEFTDCCALGSGGITAGLCNLSDRHGGARRAASPYGQINILHLDGHVRSYTWDRIKTGRVSDMHPGCTAEEARDFNAAGLK